MLLKSYQHSGEMTLTSVVLDAPKLNGRTDLTPTEQPGNWLRNVLCGKRLRNRGARIRVEGAARRLHTERRAFLRAV
ncbi:MAG: hypothetical protein JSW46_07295 [Gemmatimonadota bacterium]|nr:MAG: hypothetical protein JSW46_07295 [Gemmatimonadota bacterium]